MITTDAEIKMVKKVSESLFLLSVTLERYKPWVPGMFVQISLMKKTASEPWLDGHSFSFASWGSNRAYILVRKEGVFTTTLIDLSRDTFITSVRYPFGDFLLNSLESKVLIAGGAGVSVFLSYLDYLRSANEVAVDVLLVHSVKRQSESVKNIYTNGIPKNVSIKQFVTKSDELEYTGRPDFKVIQNSIPNLNGREYFICGPQKFNSYWRIQLMNFGINPKIEQWEN
jgi:NAD(P)H-flavin reductase